MKSPYEKARALVTVERESILTSRVVEIEGKHLAQVLYQNLFHTEREEWHQDQKVKVAFWDDSCSLITDVERGMAEKDLMGEVVKRM